MSHSAATAPASTTERAAPRAEWSAKAAGPSRSAAECVHDLADPVAVLSAMRTMVAR